MLTLALTPSHQRSFKYKEDALRGKSLYLLREIQQMHRLSIELHPFLPVALA